MQVAAVTIAGLIFDLSLPYESISEYTSGTAGLGTVPPRNHSRGLTKQRDEPAIGDRQMRSAGLSRGGRHGGPQRLVATPGGSLRGGRSTGLRTGCQSIGLLHLGQYRLLRPDQGDRGSSGSVPFLQPTTFDQAGKSRHGEAGYLSRGKEPNERLSSLSRTVGGRCFGDQRLDSRRKEKGRVPGERDLRIRMLAKNPRGDQLKLGETAGLSTFSLIVGTRSLTSAARRLRSRMAIRRRAIRINPSS